MKYSIEELRKVFINNETVVAEIIHRSAAITDYKVIYENGQKMHKFKFSDGYGPIIIAEGNEKQKEQQMKPAEIIKQEKRILEQDIRKAYKTFVEATGVAVLSIDISFVDIRTLGGPYKTHIDVSVCCADI